jgi:hypothetical protein
MLLVFRPCTHPELRVHGAAKIRESGAVTAPPGVVPTPRSRGAFLPTFQKYPYCRLFYGSVHLNDFLIGGTAGKLIRDAAVNFYKSNSPLFLYKA